MALSGPIKTFAPWGGPGTRFGGTWENLNRWDALLQNAAGEFGATNDVPDLALAVLAPVLKAMMVIESQGTMYRADGSVVVRPDDGYGGGPTVGMMQVKPQIWQWLVPGADAYSPEGNVRLGAAIMAHAIRKHGSWPAALTRVYFPAPDIQVGVEQNEYVVCVRALIKEMDAAGDSIGGGASTVADALDELVTYAGVQYAWGGIPEAWQDPWATGWDCSGMTYWAVQKYGDKTLVRGSHHQYQQLADAGLLFTTTSELRRGDLIFFTTGFPDGSGADLNRASHVGIFLGGDAFFHAANTEIDTLVSPFSGYWQGLFIGAAHTSLSLDREIPPKNVILAGDRTWDGSRDLIAPNGSVYYGHREEVEVVVDGLRRRKLALKAADETGPALNTGAKFRTLGWVVGKDEDLDPKEWWISTDFDRIWTGGTSQKPPKVDPKARPLSPRDRIVGKHVFHAADPATGKPITVTVARDGGKVYKFAAVNSPLGRKKPLKTGETFEVVEFVHSDELNGERWWWRTKNKRRINVSETVEKPYVVR